MGKSSIATPQHLPTYGRPRTSVLRPSVGTLVVKRASVSFGTALSFRTAQLSSVVRSIAQASWALGVTFGLQSTAWAAGTPPPKEYPPCAGDADETNVQAARGAFEAGKAAFHESDFPRAILYWEDAFRRDCSAVLMLKNLTRAYEANAQYPEAAVALQTYLTREPEAEDKAELEAQLEALRAKIGKPASSPDMSRPAKSGSTATSSNSPKTTTTPELRGPVAPSPDDTESAPTKGSKIAAGIVAGAGAALGLASAVFWFDANADEKAAAKECPNRTCDAATAQKGNDAIDRKQRWAIIGGAGATIMAGGIIWYLLIPDDTENVGVLPEVSPTYAGVTWSTRF